MCVDSIHFAADLVCTFVIQGSMLRVPFTVAVRNITTIGSKASHVMHHGLEWCAVVFYPIGSIRHAIEH